VVDFGTGTGTYAIELAKSRPDIRVIALDELQPMLDKVRQKLATEPLKNMEPVMARSPEASALVGKVDRVLALNVLHELGDAALGEVLALLKSSGGVLFVDWNAEAPRDYGPPKEHVYSPLEAQRRLEKAGFQVTGQKLFPHHYALVCRRAAT